VDPRVRGTFQRRTSFVAKKIARGLAGSRC
jgi:hypothetical protein